MDGTVGDGFRNKTMYLQVILKDGNPVLRKSLDKGHF